jgi:hypothetical protein
MSFHNLIDGTMLVITNMETQKAIGSNSIPRLLSMVPLIFSMTCLGCSDITETKGTHSAVNLQSAEVRTLQIADNVTIGRRTYNPETRSFDRPWPFGPEAGPQ